MELQGKDLYIHVMARYALALAHNDMEEVEGIQEGYIEPLFESKKEEDKALALSVALVLVDTHERNALYNKGK